MYSVNASPYCTCREWPPQNNRNLNLKRRRNRENENKLNRVFIFFSVLMAIECAVRWGEICYFYAIHDDSCLFSPFASASSSIRIIFRCLCACVRMYARLCERVLVDDFTLFTSFVALRVFATDTHTKKKTKKNCVYEETCIVHLICAPGYAVKQ